MLLRPSFLDYLFSYLQTWEANVSAASIYLEWDTKLHGFNRLNTMCVCLKSKDVHYRRASAPPIHPIPYYQRSGIQTNAGRAKTMLGIRSTPADCEAAALRLRIKWKGRKRKKKRNPEKQGELFNWTVTRLGLGNSTIGEEALFFSRRGGWDN